MVAHLRAQGQCLAAERTGLLVVTEEAVSPADVVERRGLGRLVAEGLVKAQRLLAMPEHIGVAALTFGQDGEIVLDLGFAEGVAEPLVHRETRGEQAVSYTH